MEQEMDQTIYPEYSKIVVFCINAEEYGVDVPQVKSIERMMEITRVPNVNSSIRGVINLRGSIVPVIDLRVRFGLDPADDNDETRIVILSLGQLEAGIIVDSCTDVADLQVNAVQPPPAVTGGSEAPYLRGVVRLDSRLITLLDLERVLKQDLLS